MRNAESLLALPTIVLIWGAIRLPARLVAAGTLTCGVVLSLVAASDDGVLRRPETTLETLVLLLLLMISILLFLLHRQMSLVFSTNRPQLPLTD